jgi:crotonobetainyl-CoA:carnitine CoA-transferase CaiB-like acyl-CoA transferase
MTALSNIRIVELSGGVAGEYCGKLLADFGAEVIKVEPPQGSPVRALSPFAGNDRGPDASALFAYLNTNKRSIVLDLESDGGRDALARLVARADVVIDDHAPGWLETVGINPDMVGASHPGLTLCTITPYGRTNAKADVLAEDLTLFHAGGWGYHTPGGVDPAKPPLKGAGRFIVSYEAGMEAALCVSAALFDQHRSGHGRVIDISKQRVMASRLDYVLAQMLVGDMDVTEARGAFDLGGPASIMPCADGFVYLWLSDTRMWWAMHDLMGKPDWMLEFPEDWLQKGCTPERVALSRQYFTQWLKTQNKHEVAAEGQKRGIMVVPINTAPDLMDSPQYQFRQFFTELDHPVVGSASYPTVPYRFSATPAVLAAPAPSLGQHSKAILDSVTQGAAQ